MAAMDCGEARSMYPRKAGRLPLPLTSAYLSSIRTPGWGVRESTAPSMAELLERFSDARCFLECAVHSLSARDAGAYAGPEFVCLIHGLNLLRSVYNDLDTHPLTDTSARMHYQRSDQAPARTCVASHSAKSSNAE